MDVVSSLCLLELGKVDSSWAESVWTDEFMGVEDLPIEYEMYLADADIDIIMETAIRSVKDDLDYASRNVYLNTVPGTSRDSTRHMQDIINWEQLIANNIYHKELLAVLCYFLHNGLDISKDLGLTRLGMKSARLYFALLTIPGSSAFLIYHPNLYRKALDIFDIARKLMKNNKTKQRPKSKGRQKGAKNKKQVASDDEDGENADNTIPPEEVYMLVSELNLVLLDLMEFIQKFSLKMDDALLQTIQHLIEVTKLEVLVKHDFTREFKYNNLIALVHNAFVSLRSLCSPLHGKIDFIVKLIMHNLLPLVLMTENSRDGPNTLKQTVSFIQFMSKTLPDDSCEGIYILVQHVCACITDRAEFRQKGSQSVVDILRFMPINLYSRFMQWLFRFAHDSKASHRLFALDIISKLLQEKERAELSEINICSSQNSSVVNASNNQSLVNDVSELAQGESVHNSVNGSNITNNINNSSVNLSVPSSADVSLQYTDILQTNSVSLEEAALQTSNTVQNCEQQAAVSHKYVLGTVISRCQDASGTVRTKAISVLADCIATASGDTRKLMETIFVLPYENSPEIEFSAASENNLLNHEKLMQFIKGGTSKTFNPVPKAEAVVSEMFLRAAEEKVFVRKAALQVLDSVMKLNQKWVLDDILQMMGRQCLDPAVLIRKHVVQSLSDLLCYYPDHEGLQSVVIECVLPRISDPETKVQEKVHEGFYRIIVNNIVPAAKECTELHKLPWKIIRKVLDSGTKRLLSKVCASWCKTNSISTGFLNTLQSHMGTDNEIPMWLLLSCLAESMRIPKIQCLLDYFFENYNTEREKVYELLAVLEILFYNWKSVKVEDRQRVGTELLKGLYCMELPIPLISPAHDILATLARDCATTPEEADITWATRLIQICERYMKEHHPDTGKLPNVCEFSRHVFALGEASQYCPEEVDKDTEYKLVKLLFPKKLPVPLKNTPFQELAVITLGKMSLQNELFAKDVVSLLGCVLRDTDIVTVKVNVINVLADLCIRYTSMVEPLIPDICVCLKDSRQKVRETALVQLVQLLQQDYLKLRGSFYYNLLSMLSDKDRTIVDSITFFITESLLVKSKNILYQNFVAGLYYYNKCATDDMFMKTTQTAKEAEVFDMSGEENAAKRNLLYKFMLEHMADEHRFNITHKICMDILGAVVNDKLSLNGAGGQVLKDSLVILASDEIKLSSLRSQSDEEPATDEAEAAAALLTTAKKAIISQCVKRNTIENIVPVIIQLKTKLQAVMSPLVLDLMHYIKELMKDFKNEIKEIFADDRTLAAEIMYDMKKHEEQQKLLEAQIAASQEAANGEKTLEAEIEPIPSTSTGITDYLPTEDFVTPRNISLTTGERKSVNRRSNRDPNTPKLGSGRKHIQNTVAENNTASGSCITPHRNSVNGASSEVPGTNSNHNKKKRLSNISEKQPNSQSAHKTAEKLRTSTNKNPSPVNCRERTSITAQRSELHVSTNVVRPSRQHTVNTPDNNTSSIKNTPVSAKHNATKSELNPVFNETSSGPKITSNEPESTPMNISEASSKLTSTQKRSTRTASATKSQSHSAGGQQKPSTQEREKAIVDNSMETPRIRRKRVDGRIGSSVFQKTLGNENGSEKVLGNSNLPPQGTNSERDNLDQETGPSVRHSNGTEKLVMEDRPVAGKKMCILGSDKSSNSTDVQTQDRQAENRKESASSSNNNDTISKETTDNSRRRSLKRTAVSPALITENNEDENPVATRRRRKNT